MNQLRGKMVSKQVQLMINYTTDNKYEPNSEVECFQAISNTGDLSLKVDNALAEGNTKDALKYKQMIIDILKYSVTPFQKRI